MDAEAASAVVAALRGGGGGACEAAAAAHKLCAGSRVSSSSGPGDDSESAGAHDLERLKELRALIQQDPRNVEALGDAGIVGVLVTRIGRCGDGHQVFVLQMMAALGYMVQKSPRRIQEALEAGAIAAIVERLRRPSSSEGVLLLAVQVLVFLVEAKVDVQQFLACKVEDALILVLERGCVRSSLLNARVANMLARMCEIKPEKAGRTYSKLLRSILTTVKVIEHTSLRARREGSNSQIARMTQLDNRCVTLCQGLGYLLDNQSESAAMQVFRAGFADIFVRLLLLYHVISPHLLETATWTITYAIAGSIERASLLGCAPRAVDLVCILRCDHRLEDGVVHAYSSLLSSVIGALATSNPIVCNSFVENILSCLMMIDEVTTTHAVVSAMYRNEPHRIPEPMIMSAQQTTGNALRVIRRISKLGGAAFDALLNGGVFKGIIDLLSRSMMFPEFLRADLLQEIGLLVEHSPRLGLHMALSGALEQLKIAIERAATVQELCNATRALACFVEHGTPQGLRITDLALTSACDDVLVKVLVDRNKRKVSYEVLLNTVGGLGYLNKRQSSLIGADCPSPAKPADASVRRRQIDASRALVDLLRNGSAGDSLMWNSLWTLIYMMNGPCATACIDAVHSAGAISLLASIIASNNKNQPLVCSAAKALFEVVQQFPKGAIEKMTLEVRLKVLACAARSRPLSAAAEMDFSAIEVAVDPSNILESTMCKFKDVDGDQLRSNALKIQYVSGEVEQVGIDAGGVRRDWLSRLSRQLFNPKFGLVISGFHPNDSVQLSPDPCFAGMTFEDQQRWYLLMGRILGLSVLYGDPLGVALVPSWCKLLLEQEPSFEDIRYVSKQYYSTFSSLRQLRDKDQDAFRASLRDLTFTVNSRELMMKEAFERDAGTPPMSPSSARRARAAQQRKQAKNLEQITSMVDLHEALKVARASQDRDMLRKLLNLQNHLLAQQAQSGSTSSSASAISPKFASSRATVIPPKDDDEIEDNVAQRVTSSSSSSSGPTSTTSSGALTPNSSEPLPSAPQRLSRANSQIPVTKRVRLQRNSSSGSAFSSDSESDEDVPANKRLRRQWPPLVQSTIGDDDEDEDDDASHGDASESGDVKYGGLDEDDEQRMKRMMSNLYEGGEMQEITPENFDRYLEMLTYKLLVENVAQQLAFVKRGFHEIVPRKLALMLINPSELRSLIEGDRDICVERWRANTVYKGGSEEDTPQLKWFWEYATSLSKEHRQKLLLWATGWRAIGQTGFAHRPFTIEVTSVETPSEEERLPSVATCSFHLWLPKYSSKAQLMRKFNLALEEASFGNC